MEKSKVITSFEFEGYRITAYLGVVRGITVRSRSLIGNIAGGFQTLFGGNISIYRDLCEQTRQESFEIMMQHADALGANGIIGMRYDANDVMSGVTEVLAYGTAVKLEKI
ncbi:MAG: YbjQ family protein [Bacteroidota bacterium]